MLFLSLPPNFYAPPAVRPKREPSTEGSNVPHERLWSRGERRASREAQKRGAKRSPFPSSLMDPIPKGEEEEEGGRVVLPRLDELGLLWVW